ncbi:MAG: hypothetical protein FWF97_00720 [Alphaproteobacteria bacterium]|nr:hypothetical protein [Alphaproteobacteria bacterium]
MSEICAIYAPGVELDLFVDDLIDEKLNNLTADELVAYGDSFQEVMNFVKKFLPDNFDLKMTKVSQLFETPEAFWKSLQKNLELTPLPELSEKQIEKIELNVRLLPDQGQDPLWREKVMQLHNAFSATKKEPKYHHGRKDKVLLSADPVPSGIYVEIGTTPSSVAKHWVGAGVLMKKNDGYRMRILSAHQISDSDFEWQPIDIPGLTGKNFHKIRII